MVWPMCHGPAVSSVLVIETSAEVLAVPPLSVLSVLLRELRALGYDDYLTSEVSQSERGAGQTMADTAARMDQIIAM